MSLQQCDSHFGYWRQSSDLEALPPTHPSAVLQCHLLSMRRKTSSFAPVQINFSDFFIFFFISLMCLFTGTLYWTFELILNNMNVAQYRTVLGYIHDFQVRL